MTLYTITKKQIAPGSLDEVSAAMETYIETIDTTKTIRLYAIFQYGSGSYQGVIHHDT